MDLMEMFLDAVFGLLNSPLWELAGFVGFAACAAGLAWGLRRVLQQWSSEEDRQRARQWGYLVPLSRPKPQLWSRHSDSYRARPSASRQLANVR